MLQRNFIKNILKFQILFLLPWNCISLPVNIINISATEHLNNQRVKDICEKRHSICRSSVSINLCTVRMVKGKLQFKEFANDCLLFLDNVCKFPGNEWAIKNVGSCVDVDLRRYVEQVENVTETGMDKTELTETTVDHDSTVDDNITETATLPALRSVSRSTYDVEAAPDNHPCPYHCPKVYSPVCTNINRAYGKYYRLLFFVNHCEADRHYCMYWATEYTPPPYEDYEMVNRPSNAAWSYCAANKYMNFVTFAESASSLSHYGWLVGPQRAKHILEPYERIPGVG